VSVFETCSAKAAHVGAVFVDNDIIKLRRAKDGNHDTLSSPRLSEKMRVEIVDCRIGMWKPKRQPAGMWRTKREQRRRSG